MIQLIVRRLLLLIPTVIIVTFGVFSLTAIAPGDAATFLAGGETATPERIAEIRDQLGLNDPFFVQYGNWLGDAVQLDFGESLVTDNGVFEEIRNRLPITLSIAGGAIIIGLLLGVPIGIISGARQGGWVDRTLLFLTSGGLSVPNFVLAILLVNYFAIELGWFRAVGFTRPTAGLGGWIQDLTLPATALGIGMCSRLARQVRAGVVDTLHAPYVRTAWAKGCRPISVVGKHVFKNAAIPSVTILGLLVGGLLGGTVIVEEIFAAPGLGEFLVRSTINNDLPVVQGIAVMFVLAYAIINLLVDVAYGWLNPKVTVA